MPSPSSVLQVRINHIDYTLSEPGPFDNSDLYRVPVLRVYGISSTGKKTCAHVHQVYPYFFIEYTGVIDPSSVNNYIARLTRSLNHALAISLKRDPAKLQFIRAILLVKGVHFYGFHSAYAPFLKIYIVDPACLNRAATLMQSGVVMKTRFCIYESHISFPLQFMCDFGLYGCGWIDLAEVSKRGEDQDDLDSQVQSSTFNASPHPIQSRMELEVDVEAYHILNRHLITARNLHHKLTIPAPQLPNEPLVLSVRELWEDERRRRQARGLDPTPELPVDPSENSRETDSEWVAEARWWDEIRNRIERERDEEDKPCDDGWGKWVPTTFESVDGLWKDEYKIWKPAFDDSESSDTDPTNSNPFGTLSGSSHESGPDNRDEKPDDDVDEKLLSSQHMTQLVEQEEAEWDKLVGEGIFDDVGDLEDPFIDEGGLPAGEHSPSEQRHGRKNGLEMQLLSTSTRTPSPLKRDRPSNYDLATVSRYPSPTLSNLPVTPTKSTCKQMSTPTRYSREWPGRKRKTIDPLLISSPADRVALDAARASLRTLHTVQKGQTAKDVFDSSPNPFDDTTAHSERAVSRPTKRRKIAIKSVQFDSPLVSSQNYPVQSPRLLSQSATVPFSQQQTRATKNVRSYSYSRIPPSTSELLLTLDEYGIPNKIYQDPYYSNEGDAPERTKEYAGLLFFIRGGTGLSTLREWDDGSDMASTTKGQPSISTIDPVGISGWEYASCPPSLKQTLRWLTEEASEHDGAKNKRKASSQIEGPTQANIYGLNTTPIGPSDGNPREKQSMTMLCLEIFVPSRSGLMPDPGTDEVVAAFYSFQGADNASPDLCKADMIIVENEHLDPKRLRNHRAETVPNELELLNRMADIIIDLDPDIIAGWEIQSSSWGYLEARAKHYGLDFGELISRAPGKRRSTGSDQWGAHHTSTFKVIGRHVLNVWRIMRVEQNLETYTFENTVFHLLRQRFPRYTSRTLTNWYQSPHSVHTIRVLNYMKDKTTIVLRMLDASETVTKTAEFARIFGVDFFSVISRGSQFKVESFMFRIAKPESFVLLSPSRNDVGTQNAAECMPLIMEPQSDFYSSPLVVLDFQSLYPSIMIAYNYCYSTCMGRVVDFKGQSKFGVTNLKQPAGSLEKLKDHINVAPNGIIYVKPEVRKGLLGRMLKELLETRVMVKQAMKGVKGDKALRRVLDARQLGLKYISNVTYGYTSATFSGRMPAVEIADSIVQSGRETLEKAISIIESTTKWGAKVVYGDTDSLFIYLPGRTKEQAFRIGFDISDTITKMNPAPIKLKFEKVYLPCVLMAKKRYVGFKYENPDDKEPGFDAKGIETVRRDGVLAQRKMTETCLKILFRTQDLSKVKEYCYSSWSKVLANKAPIQDFIFAKEVRLGTYSDRVPPPPGAMVAARNKMIDTHSEPQYGDRVPYVITRGEPQSKLVDRAVAPEELFEDRQKQLDAVYYITRVLIPPLDRIFNLVGVDVRAWYDEMPKMLRVDQVDNSLPLSPSKHLAEVAGPSGNRLKIDDHFRTSKCLICTSTTEDGICDLCRRVDHQSTIIALSARIQRIETRLQNTHMICISCTGSASTEPIECVSLDCPWLFARKKAEEKANFVVRLHDLISEMADDGHTAAHQILI